MVLSLVSWILGVPQGSALGPFLFTVHINNIGLCIKSLHINLYADDMVMYAIELTVKATVPSESILTP
jgi:hypothetical protein